MPVPTNFHNFKEVIERIVSFHSRHQISLSVTNSCILTAPFLAGNFILETASTEYQLRYFQRVSARARGLFWCGFLHVSYIQRNNLFNDSREEPCIRTDQCSKCFYNSLLLCKPKQVKS